jgi:hypothetical protein
LVCSDRPLPAPQPRRSVGEHEHCAELEGRVTDPDWFDKLARLVFDNNGDMITGPGGRREDAEVVEELP